ncbi:MAG: nickel-dependent hydrogenase large subunit [Bacillota bacterium]|nr:nickel-dependent hydrogenase large subunit [Bacillota bacterium]
MGKVVIPIGPQHPALKEPENFVITLDGEKVVAAAVNLGYNHRGIEKACEQRTYLQDIYLIERICGICSHAHSTAFIQAAEEIAEVEIPRRAAFIRTLIGELERIHSHFLWLGVAGHEVGFDTLFMYSWRDRELVLDLVAKLTGNRVNYGINTLGGVRRDISPEEAAEIRKVIGALEERTKYYLGIASEETTLISRFLNVGRLSKEDALRLGATGPVARAADIKRDVRKDDPYAAYGEIPFDVITDTHADVLGRTLVRVKELMECYKIIRYILDNMPEGLISVRFPRRVPEGEAFSRYEAPRGEDVHYVKSNGMDKPERVKVRAPTMANAASVAHMLSGGYLADVPIVIAAIDPCFSCTDRTIRVRDIFRGSDSVLDWPALRDYSIRWYRENGLDFSGIKLFGREIG